MFFVYIFGIGVLTSLSSLFLYRFIHPIIVGLTGDKKDSDISNEDFFFAQATGFITGFGTSYIFLVDRFYPLIGPNIPMWIIIPFCLLYLWGVVCWSYIFILAPALQLIGFIIFSIEKIWNKFFPKSESETDLANDFRDEFQKAREFKARMWKFVIFIGVIILYIYFYVE